MDTKYNLITITGATAGGKTSVAVNLASKLNTEIISADSRQVYKGMDIGTGKDIEEYNFDGVDIPCHLVDIVDAGSKYNVYEFQKDFLKVYKEISDKGKLPILCGGTGMYVESVLKDYELIYVPADEDLRDKLSKLDISELEKILVSYKRMHNRSDLDTTKRAIRAIEIADYYDKNNLEFKKNPKINSLIIAVKFERDQRRARITERLKSRLEGGMIQEAETLHANGLSFEDMEYYGLEYKWLAYYLSDKITYDEMFEGLNTAIHQFSKRQMTWFRKMEKNGIEIHWLDGNLEMEKKMDFIMGLL